MLLAGVARFDRGGGVEVVVMRGRRDALRERVTRTTRRVARNDDDSAARRMSGKCTSSVCVGHTHVSERMPTAASG